MFSINGLLLLLASIYFNEILSQFYDILSKLFSKSKLFNSYLVRFLHASMNFIFLLIIQKAMDENSTKVISIVLHHQNVELIFQLPYSFYEFRNLSL
jgi:hypothetical protein